MWLWMSDCVLLYRLFLISTYVVYLWCCIAGATWNCCRQGAISVYTIQPCTSLQCHFNQSHIGRVYVCLVVTCHLHFWRNDRDLLRATAVTRGWNGYRNKSQHRKLSMEKKKRKKKNSRRSCGDSNQGPFDHESDALTTELFPLPLYPLALARDVNGRLERFTRDSPPCPVVLHYQ